MRIFVSMLTIVFVILFASCSMTNPTAIDYNSPESSVSFGNSAIAGSGQIILDSSGTLEIVPDRNPEWHYNVTGLLAGGCPGGCFSYQILDISGEVWTIELTIENPTSLQVYDVRILYYNRYGKKILNQDGYIDLFGYSFTPFTAFAKEYENRAFPVGPSAVDTEILELGWPAGQPPQVAYLIEVSLGGNCEEPWKIEGSLSDDIPTGGGRFQISATVYDWQSDVHELWCNWSEIGGIEEKMQATTEGNGFITYSLGIDVPPGQTQGVYPVLLSNKPLKPTVYNIIYATVH